MSYVMTPLAVIHSAIWFQKVSQAYRWWRSNKLEPLAAADVSASYFICSCPHLLLDLGKNIFRFCMLKEGEKKKEKSENIEIKKEKNTKRSLRLGRCKEVLEDVMSVVHFKYMVGLL